MKGTTSGEICSLALRIHALSAAVRCTAAAGASISVVVPLAGMLDRTIAELEDVVGDAEKATEIARQAMKPGDWERDLEPQTL